jgi:deoxyhypusine synthase
MARRPPNGRNGEGRAAADSVLPPRDGEDGFVRGLEPVVPIDPRRIASVDDLVRAMGRTAFGGRQVGEAADLLVRMASDPDCFVVATLSGAMTVAKMGGLLVEMIDRGIVHAVVSTGALVTHGLVEAGGMSHFRWREDMDDEALFRAGYNRVHDTLELERNLDDVGALLASVLEGHDPAVPVTSWTVCRKLGRALIAAGRRRGILQSAYRRRVPVFIPAFTDCELGLDFGLLNRRRRAEGVEPLRFDPFLDLDAYADLVGRQERLGIFTIGGGVPRNWAQQVGPYLDLLGRNLPGDGRGFRPFTYGIRVCPDPVHWGHLSGCTYAEGVSWGKFLPREKGGRWAEVLMDATVAWPVILQAALERLDRTGRAYVRPSRDRRWHPAPEAPRRRGAARSAARPVPPEYPHRDPRPTARSRRRTPGRRCGS